MNISLGFSPCPNDTFMFAALVNHWIDTKNLRFEVFMEDVEQLNTWAGSGKLDVTKMSFHRSLSLAEQYTLLSSGAALGEGCGPLLISKKDLTPAQIKKGPIALPGKWTTAHLLFNIFYPDCEVKTFLVFNQIEEAILKGEVVAGVIIHENRFTYQGKGLHKINDLGESWEEKTGMPIPLGGIFASNTLPREVIIQMEELIHDSILFAYLHPEKVMSYVRQFAQEMDEDVMKDHIHLYVNSFSLDLGDKGRAAISVLKKFSL